MNKEINWDALKSQAAIAAMQTMIGELFDVENYSAFAPSVAKFSVEYADALIAELKKEENAELRLRQSATKTGGRGDFISVGETFEFEGELFKCVEAKDDCVGCAFYKNKCGAAPLCISSMRHDGKNVIFQKVERIN